MLSTAVLSAVYRHNINEWLFASFSLPHKPLFCFPALFSFITQTTGVKLQSLIKTLPPTRVALLGFLSATPSSLCLSLISIQDLCSCSPAWPPHFILPPEPLMSHIPSPLTSPVITLPDNLKHFHIQGVFFINDTCFNRWMCIYKRLQRLSILLRRDKCPPHIPAAFSAFIENYYL